MFCFHCQLTILSPLLPIANYLHMKLYRNKKTPPRRVLVSLTWYKNFVSGLFIKASQVTGREAREEDGCLSTTTVCSQRMNSRKDTAGSHQWQYLLKSGVPKAKSFW